MSEQLSTTLSNLNMTLFITPAAYVLSTVDYFARRERLVMVSL